MNKMRVIAAYGEYEVGLTIHGCAYFKDAEGYDFNVDSAFDAIHLIEDKEVRYSMAKQIAPVDFTATEEQAGDLIPKHGLLYGTVLDRHEVDNAVDNIVRLCEEA